MLQIAIIGIINAGLAALISSGYGVHHPANSSQPSNPAQRSHPTRHILLTHHLHCSDKFDCNTPPLAYH